MPRHALHASLLAREQAHQQVRLMERPRAQHNRFAVVRNLAAFGHSSIVSPTKDKRGGRSERSEERSVTLRPPRPLRLQLKSKSRAEARDRKTSK